MQIWTSSLTLAEVYKRRGAGTGAQLPAQHDQDLDAFFEQEFIIEVQVDHDIATRARGLLREHTPPLRNPMDAVHLATALANNLDELHTFDGNNLLPLDGQLARADGVPLQIREPPPPIIAQQQDFFPPPIAPTEPPAAAVGPAVLPDGGPEPEALQPS